jgi:hypothetical protein
MFHRETFSPSHPDGKFLSPLLPIPSSYFATPLSLASGVHFPSGDNAPRGPSGVFTRLSPARVRRIPGGYGALRMTLIADERDCAEQLARFFPKLPPVRIPVRVSSFRSGKSSMQEATVVEFGTGDYAIFLSKLALEFDDRVRLVRDGGRPTEAIVIALQYHQGRKAVAVRFLDRPCEWMK